MMKRCAVVLLAMALLLGACVVPAWAAPSATIAVGTVSGLKGDVVELPITISANSYLVNADLIIEYDGTRLELVNDRFAEGCYQTGPILDTRWMTAGAARSAGKFWFSLATGDNVGLSSGGELFRLAFRILKDDAASMTVSVKADPVLGNDGSGAPDSNGLSQDVVLDCTTVAGAVSISAAEPGDLNFDGRISMQDALMLYVGVSQNNLTPERTEVSDYNGDGAVNMRDVLALYAFVASNG